MATRKKNDTAARFTVVLEDLHAKFAVFGEALQDTNEKMDRRFDAIDRRFDAIDLRFEAVDRRFEAVEGDLALVKRAVLENSREIRVLRAGLDEVRGTVTRTEQALAKKVDRDEIAHILAR